MEQLAVIQPLLPVATSGLTRALRRVQINVAGFDNVGTSILTMFQITTLSNWNYVMYRTMDSAGGVAVIFYLLIVVLGTYFIMILFLAVLKLKFSKAQEVYVAAAAASTGSKRENLLVKSYRAMKTGFSVITNRIMPAGEGQAEEADDGYVARHIVANKVMQMQDFYHVGVCS